MPTASSSSTSSTLRPVRGAWLETVVMASRGGSRRRRRRGRRGGAARGGGGGRGSRGGGGRRGGGCLVGGARLADLAVGAAAVGLVTQVLDERLGVLAGVRRDGV